MSDNKIEFTNDTWEYRVVRRELEDGSDEWYSVQEVYFGEDKTPYAYTLDLQVENDTITGMRTQLEKMLEALDNPVLDESDIVEDNLNTNDWNCEICGESTENVEYDYIGSGTNHLKCELTGKKSYKDKALELGIENAELKDRLEELGEKVKSIPNDMELGENIRKSL